MDVVLINPENGEKLVNKDEDLIDSSGNVFKKKQGFYCFVKDEGYTENFGVQWKKFAKTQLDQESEALNLSEQRFFAETHLDVEDLSGKNILEVGSGAGRFSKVILEKTQATLYSVDYSEAVMANWKNNGFIAPNRFHLFQSSIYEMPFENDSFDKVVCLGVLQHTPDFELSVKSLISKAKRGGEVVVDFYPIKNCFTKIHAKYILRPLTKKMQHQNLMAIIEKNIDWLLKAHFALHKIGLGIFARFLPIVDVQNTFPKCLDTDQIREWAVLDTFDMFSPAHDHPQKIKDVVAMFERNGARVTFSGYEPYGQGFKAPVVRGVKVS